MTHTISERFMEAIRYDHIAVAYAELSAGEITVMENLPILSGTVTDDSQAMVRRRLTCEVACEPEVLDLMALQPPTNGGLWPLGNEIHVTAGIKYDDGTEELAHVGVFRISRPNVRDNGQGLTLRVDGFDRSRAISRNKFTDPYTISIGTNFSDAIKDLLQNRLPSLADDQFSMMDTTFTTPELIFDHEDDPWDVAIKMAASIGAELFFDGHGNVVMRPEPDPAFTPSSFDFIEGEEATLVEISRDLGDEEAYNGVVVIGESSSAAPVRAEAWDINPNSPTYYDPAVPLASKYGAVPYIVTSPYITSTAQAQDAANAELARVLGVLEHIDFQAINNPAIESGDVIRLIRSRINVDSTYILNSVTLGLGLNSSMAGVTRKRRAT